MGLCRVFVCCVVGSVVFCGGWQMMPPQQSSCFSSRPLRSRSFRYNGYQPKVVGIADGIAAAFPDNVDTTYIQGCDVDLTSSPPCFCCKPTVPGFADAVAAAAASSVTVVVVGTYSGIESASVDRTNLKLPGQQAALIRAVAKTGAPLFSPCARFGVRC